MNICSLTDRKAMSPNLALKIVKKCRPDMFTELFEAWYYLYRLELNISTECSNCGNVFFQNPRFVEERRNSTTGKFCPDNVSMSAGLVCIQLHGRSDPV